MPDQPSPSSRSEKLVPILLGIILAAMLVAMAVAVAVLLGLWPQ